MRYAIVSDIHANMQAWNAVLLDIRSSKVDRIICLGDIIGYGPHPAEVLQSVYANVDHLVLGNHDAVICGKLDASLFNESAREIILWTKDHLAGDALKFLQSLPLSLHGGFFRCAHGDFAEPAAFNYVIDPEDALPSWQAVDEHLLFVGHTHQPAIFLLGQSGTPRVVDPQDFALEPEKRFLVNVGSVGQPRDGEARACYCIFDTNDNSVRWRRIPFDLDAFREDLDKAGVSAKPSYFLRHDPRLGRPPLRELLNFSPPTTPDKVVKNTVEVQELQVLQRSVKKWKMLFSAILCLGLTLGIAIGSGWWRYHNRALIIKPATMAVVSAPAVPADQNMLSMPKIPVPAGQSVPGWSVRLGDRRRQSVRVDSYPESAVTDQAESGKVNPVIVLSSATGRDEISLSSSTVRVTPGMKLCWEALFKKSDDFSGNIAVVLSLTRESESGKEVVDQFIVKEPSQPRQGGWLLAKQTFTVPANAYSIEYQVRGKFTGEAMIKDISLQRKQ